MNTENLEKPLRRKEAAEYIQNKYNIPCKASTLGKYASVGGGPKFLKAGKFPLYPPSQLDIWAISKFSPLKSSTSDNGGNHAVA